MHVSIPGASEFGTRKLGFDMTKTESIFALLQSGPKTTEQIERHTELTSKQIWGLLNYHIKAGRIQRKDERFYLIDEVQQRINEAVRFLESHGYVFD